LSHDPHPKPRRRLSAAQLALETRPSKPPRRRWMRPTSASMHCRLALTTTGTAWARPPARRHRAGACGLPESRPDLPVRRTAPALLDWHALPRWRDRAGM